MSAFLFILSADASCPVFLGWSEDGTKAALLQYGVHDGSGFPFAYLEVIGPNGTDRFFYEDLCYEEESNDEWLAQIAKESAKTQGVPGDKTGKKLEPRLTDSLARDEPSCTRITKRYRVGSGELCLEEIIQDQTLDPYIWPQGKIKGFWQDKRIFSLVLAGNGFSWWLEEAYSYKGRVALILGHLEPGFEGPDTRFRLIVIEER